MSVTVVIPTVGRPSLTATLAPLADLPIVVVDDRRSPGPLPVPTGVTVLRSGGRGPAAARNTGWRACSTEWVAFLDDDVVPPASWCGDLVRDLGACPTGVAGSQGGVHVPLPARPDDWDRSTAGLEGARWATADMAYRTAVLAAVGGFDERFPRAYREDADLALRVLAAGWRITRGDRRVQHPVRRVPWTVSVRQQRGNADDVLMQAVHGRLWRERAGVPAGRRRWHLATTAALAATALPSTRPVAAPLWLALTADFAVRRIRPGPRQLREVATMTVTSLAIPPAATWWWLAGWARLPGLLRRGGP